MNGFETCTDCGGVYPFLARGVCADCLNDRERSFYVVRDWLRDNRGARTEEASEATGVRAELILEWIQQGRLSVVAQPDDRMLADRMAQDALRERLKGDLLKAVEESPAPAAPGGPRIYTRRKGHA